MEMFSLKNRVAIITGGSKGLGKEAAKALAKAGAYTVLVSRNQKEADDSAQEISQWGPESIGIQTDITQQENIETMVKATINHFGQIDILVNNAGIISRKFVLDIDVDDWSNILNTNVVAAHMCTKAVGQHMMERKSGNIINMASICASIVVPDRGAYAVSKAGLVQLTKHLAVELASHGIRCNAVCPSSIETDLHRQMIAKGAKYDFIDWTPMKRFGKPEEIGGAVVYLASDASSYVTGTTIYIDGGLTAV
jgi:NAD(P)-dependent dehydrogenase (short-subunit alcohol dehydrogenase family)